MVYIYLYSWCGPCKLLGPRLESIIAGEKGRITLAKVDIDENAELAMRFNVSSFLFFVFLSWGFFGLRKSISDLDIVL